MTTQTFITLAEATKLVHTLADKVSVLLEGPPGIGKSGILKSFSEDHYEIVYCDCARLGPEDLEFPLVDRGLNEARFVPNAHFKLSAAKKSGKAVVVMLDELGKAKRATMNVLLPLMLERRLGDTPLPEGSFVFATTNLLTDGVGDAMPSHAYNRLVSARVIGPTCDEWASWAINNNIAPEVLSWVVDHPEVFDNYLVSRSGVPTKDNYFIFNPHVAGQTNWFCSPRSLSLASHVVRNRGEYGHEVMMAALAGTIGSAASASMLAHIKFADTLPKIEDIVKAPSTTPLVDGVACFIQAVTLAASLDKNNHEAFVAYMDRYTMSEPKALFIKLLTRRGVESIRLLLRNDTAEKMTHETYNISLLG